MTTLAELGIRVRLRRPGEQRTACPECARAKSRPRDDALAVKLEPDGGATWFCHRCDWTGGLGGTSGHERRRPGPGRPPPEAGPGFPEVAARLWASRRPVAPGTVAGRYLEGRGCALPPPDGDLAWHPEVYHPHERRPSPALLALVTDALTAAPMTLHRTFLAPDGGGKARVAKPRLLVKGGGKKGGVVRLWPDEEVVYGLCVGEGLETLLSAARGFTPVWACLDSGNLGALPVLPGVEALTIVADHDEPGVRAADACARRWREAGREVRRWRSPREGADFNDFVGEAAA